MRQQLSVIWLASAMLAAACGRAPAVDEEMKRDLQAASAGSIELAPGARGQEVVSPVEQIQKAQPAPAPTRTRAPAPTRAKVAEVPSPEPAPVATQPAEQQSNEPAAARPSQRPLGAPAPPPGGYKTVGEVIRNAPFPIMP